MIRPPKKFLFLFVYHGGLLFLTTCGLPLGFTIAYFILKATIPSSSSSSSSSSLSSLMVLIRNDDTLDTTTTTSTLSNRSSTRFWKRKIQWFQYSSHTSTTFATTTTGTLIPLSSPLLDIRSLEQYIHHPPHLLLQQLSSSSLSTKVEQSPFVAMGSSSSSISSSTWMITTNISIQKTMDPQSTCLKWETYQLYYNDYYCSTTVNVYPYQTTNPTTYLSGIYYSLSSQDDNSNSSSLRLDSILSSSSSSSIVSILSSWIPMSSSSTKTILFLPTTWILLGLQILLAFAYWNAHISPFSVGLLPPSPSSPRRQQQQQQQQQQQRHCLNTITTLTTTTTCHVQQHTEDDEEHEEEITTVEEPWRLLTGATAHFDLWHLGMNMMTLHSLGKVLENQQQQKWYSIIYMATHISLIVYVGMVWWYMQKLFYAYGSSFSFSSLTTTTTRRSTTNPNHHQHHQQQQQHRIPTVGYSGVLFAWMVILSLEQHQNQIMCPIFFLPNWCFSAITIWNHISIHPGPFIQLVMIQVLLRHKASWTGHLAGILVGLVLQWNIIPYHWWCWWPSCSIPLMYYLWCIRQHRTRFLACLFQQQQQQQYRLSSSATGAASIHSKWYLCVGIMHGLFFVISIYTLDGVHSILTLEYLLVNIWWWSTRPDDITMARGYVVLVVLVLITDAMTAGAWMVVFRPILFISMVPSMVTLWSRMLLLLTSLVWMIHIHRLYQDDTKGIFYYSFHWTVLKPVHGMIITMGNMMQAEYVREEGSSPWERLGPGRRLGRRHNDTEMVQLL